MKLHLILALLAGMSALAAAQSDPRDFEFLEMDDDSDDISADDMRTDREAATTAIRTMTTSARSSLSSSYARLMQKQSVQTAAGDVPLPPGYLLAMERNMPMFDNFRTEDVPLSNVVAINVTLPPPTTTTTTRRPIIDLEVAGLAAAAGREKRNVPTNLYYCPHRNYLLTWFLGSERRICFVPWAWNQRITYARCTTSTCNIRKGRTGRCRPSCFQRRYIFALCYYRPTGSWQWRWELKNLPQACRCSTC